ncbi:MAG: T9SS C-terminal target domain-containing protein [Candidatus Zixiibacteriota bacterium]|nr:MAG: T9SS C-terminal target domain-containing protein [candidate division Zixibacteria bacterium]
MAGAAVTSDQALALVERQLLPQGREAAILKIWGPVPAGRDVRGLLEYVFTTPAEGYVIYLDDDPTANPFHPVRYVFVDGVRGTVTPHPAQSPPENEGQYRTVETAIWKLLAAAENRWPAPPGRKPHPLPPSRGERWAVLMNGGAGTSSNYPRYWNDLSNIYMALSETYGWPDDRIIVLCSDGTNPAPDQSNGQNSDPDLDGDGDPDIMYACTLAEVDMVFGWLATQLSADDKLFIFTTDHGSSNGGWNTSFNLWAGQMLSDAHFAQLLDALPDCEIICTFEPCYSGGFLDNVVVPPGPRVASSACAYNQVSYAMPPGYVYDTYVFHWTAAVKGEDAYGVVVDADYNNDGLVDMLEAFRYAEEHDQSNEDPQYMDYPAGVGTGLSLWPTGPGPFLVVSGTAYDDVGGNNNGQPDPGETVTLEVELNNVGNDTARNVTATLYSLDRFVTVTQNFASFPDLGHFQLGLGMPLYQMNLDAQCPIGHVATCSLSLAADSAYSTSSYISFMIGDPMTLPVGPDAHGYCAWDTLDGGEYLVYDWQEIAPQAGGTGTVLNLTSNNQTVGITLPFTFRYYGQDFFQASVSTDGWMALGWLTTYDYSNSAIPNADGPPNMIAAFWDDLNPTYGNTQICTRYDTTQQRFIVEWCNIAHNGASGTRETFQVLLYNPIYWHTATGDGMIQVQYHTVVNTASATFGIENGTETVGLQVGYNGAWDEHAVPLGSRRSLVYTTGSAVTPAPVNLTLTPVGSTVIPAPGGSFTFDVALANGGTSTATFSAWINQQLPSGQWQGPLLGPIFLSLPGGASLTRQRVQTVPGTAQPGEYLYCGYAGLYPVEPWDSSFFTYTKLTTGDGDWVEGWANWGESFAPYLAGSEPAAALPLTFGLRQNHPNPFNPSTALRYQLTAYSHVSLKVYDSAGRVVATLVDGWREAGSHEVTFDGTGLASGLYFARLQAGRHSQTVKMMLLK